MNLTALRDWWQGRGTRRRWIVAGTGFAGLTLLLGAWLYVAAKDRVCLVVDGRASVVETRARSVGDLLASAGVTLGKGDAVEPDAGSSIREGLTVRVHRAFPVQLVVGGVAATIRTIACPVAEILKVRGIELGEYDRVTPDLGCQVKPGQTVRVVRVAIKEVTYREEIPPKSVIRKDAGLNRGVTKLVREGVPGLVERTACIRMEDGRELERDVLSTNWLRWPVSRIVAQGTRPVIRTYITSRGHTVRYTDTLTMTATAYYPGPESCGVNAKGITKSGARATYGVVAVDPRVIPLGTRLYVEGYGFATALDTGSAIKGYKIDLCFDTYREAIMYGKRKVKVYILAG